MEANRLTYCQYLLSSQINYTLTNFADHAEEMSHDSINRYLRNTRVTGSDIWKQVQKEIVSSEQGYIVFDDTVLDKDYSHKIELVRPQYSGNAHGIIKGIGVVNCMYVNPETDQYWIIDFRIYAPQVDGKSKLDHAQDMLKNTVEYKSLLVAAVLMDSWYATRKMMLLIESLHLYYYCPLHSNRLVDDSSGTQPYRHVNSLQWSKKEIISGKTVKIKSFPKNHKVKLFRVAVSKNRTDFVVTNDSSQKTTSDIHQVYAWRWKIEQFHREAKQLTGLEKCECRKARIQRNHIACAFIVWTRLTQWAKKTAQTIYRTKRKLLDDYLYQQLKNPSINMQLA